MTDKEHFDVITKACDNLNKAINNALKDGLNISVDDNRISSIGIPDKFFLSVRLFREVDGKEEDIHSS